MHIDIIVDQSNDKWMENTQNRIIQITREIKSYLNRAGAYRVTIEPRIKEINEQKQWTLCTDTSCQTSNLTCCNLPRILKNKETPSSSSV